MCQVNWCTALNHLEVSLVKVRMQLQNGSKLLFCLYMLREQEADFLKKMFYSNFIEWKYEATTILPSNTATWNPEILEHPRQTDGYNCGIFCLQVL